MLGILLYERIPEKKGPGYMPFHKIAMSLQCDSDPLHVDHPRLNYHSISMRQYSEQPIILENAPELDTKIISFRSFQ